MFPGILISTIQITPIHSIVDACHKKCIVPNYADGDLNKGESVCVDRCVAKYLEVNKIIGEKFGSMAQQAQQGVMSQ